LTNIDIHPGKDPTNMEYHDHTISWMIGGGLRGDPEEVRNRAHLRALRETQVRPSLADRVRAFVRGTTPIAATPVDQVCCAA
jgi:hypothetical protein